jgi:catechol 2,3-dioxygenase-like lactoylglutathione lyase family enzyme
MVAQKMRTLAIVAAVALAACRDGAHPSAQRGRPFDASAAECHSKGLGCPRPIFGVANLKTSVAYYRDVLGFKLDWDWGDPPDFASVTRSGLTLFVGVTTDPGHGALWTFAGDVDALHAELRRRGARIKMPPTNMPWGNRELHVLDPDGNLLRFAGPTRR